MMHSCNRSGSRPRTGRTMLPLIALLVFAAALAAGVLPRLAQSRERVKENSLSNAPPVVFTEGVTSDSTATAFELPATVAGLHETSIFSRTNGFVRELRVDIGAYVNSGDTLVVLDMPELHEQERQAEAVLDQAQASARLAESTLERWKQLSKQGAVTPQELDERSAAAGVTAANVRAAKANLSNLREQLKFGVLTAPFAGIVTSRSIDIGSLVSAGQSSGAKPLLSLVETDTVRVMLQIPQSASSRIHTGTKVAVNVRDAGNGDFSGVVVRTAGAIDPATRTLLTEVHVPNHQRRLLPGMIASVKFEVPSAPSLSLPATALIVRAQGTLVARIEHDTVRMVPVKIIRDLGTSLQVEASLTPGDQLVVNPIESLAAGQVVRSISRDQKTEPAS